MMLRKGGTSVNKRPILALTLAGSLLLSGCSSLLLRDYSSVTVHSAAPTVESDQLTIRVESYQDLVNTLLYFITQGQEEGVIRLYNYPYDVNRDLEAACTEVVQEDPLGAYAVDRIQYDVVPIVSCYEASFRLTYRRTHEQVACVVAATGASSIRSELKKALSQFQEESVLRISYFDEDETYIQSLLRQAYFSSPGTALEFPRFQINFYPDSGRQRIVEILFDYELDQAELNRRKTALSRLAREISGDLWDAEGDSGLLKLRQAILSTASYDPQGGSTAYHALSEHQADSLGLAFAMCLLCQELEYPCQVVEGTLDGSTHYWNVLLTEGGYRHVDLSRPLEDDADSPFLSDRQVVQEGYQWSDSSVPQCGEQPLP